MSVASLPYTERDLRLRRVSRLLQEAVDDEGVFTAVEAWYRRQVRLNRLVEPWHAPMVAAVADGEPLIGDADGGRECLALIETFPDRVGLEDLVTWDAADPLRWRSLNRSPLLGEDAVTAARWDHAPLRLCGTAATFAAARRNGAKAAWLLDWSDAAIRMHLAALPAFICDSRAHADAIYRALQPERWTPPRFSVAATGEAA